MCMFAFLPLPPLLQNACRRYTNKLMGHFSVRMPSSVFANSCNFFVLTTIPHFLFLLALHSKSHGQAESKRLHTWWLRKKTYFFALLSVPPDKPKIYDERGQEMRLKLGPYRIGDTVVLKCTAYGGEKKKKISLVFSIIFGDPVQK